MDGYTYNKNSVLEKYDDIPTSNSTNLVDSGHIKTYVDSADATIDAKVDQMIDRVGNPFVFKGTVAATSNLPSSGNTINDTYFVEAQGFMYTWNGTSWDKSSTDVNNQLAHDIATEYSETKADYKAGDIVLYNNQVYVRNSDATAAEGTFVTANWTATSLGDELSEEITNLKSAIDGVSGAIALEVITSPIYVSHSYITSDGNIGVSSAYNSYKIDLAGVKKIRVKSRNNKSRNTAMIAFYNSDTTVESTTCLLVGRMMPKSMTTEYTDEYYVPKNAVEVRMVCDIEFSIEVTAIYYDPLENGVTKEQTIYSGIVNDMYLARRYLDYTGLPTTTNSTTYTLHKVDVSNCSKVEIKTYRSGPSDSSKALPMYSIVSTDFDDVTLISESSDTVVAVGENISPTDEIVNIKTGIPDGGKTMYVVVKTDREADLEIKGYYYNDFKDLYKDVEELKDDYTKSPYYRNIKWGCSSFDCYYHSVDSGISDFPYTTTAEQYYTKFNDLVSNYEDYAESHIMGIASDGLTTMYYYTFNPLTDQESQTFQRPKIIISAGQHGFEKTANFGVYYFIKDLLENWENNSFLSYVRNHVKLVVMPMLNPYGFDHDTYTNANGVNLNRNWDTLKWSGGTQGTVTYGGEEPLDQPETQYASAVILDNLDALWLCDYHNNGQVAPSSARSYLWHSFALVTYEDKYFEKGMEAAKWHVDEITGHLYIDYPDQCQYNISGHISDNNAPSHQGLITAYAREHNIMAATMEGGAAFIGSGNRYSSPIQHMNADLLGNWIRCLLATFEHYSVR